MTYNLHRFHFLSHYLSHEVLVKKTGLKSCLPCAIHTLLLQIARQRT